MKKRRLIGILLLLAMNFSMLHAFTISFMDEHQHSVSEYMQEFSQPSAHNESSDICDIHHMFHMVCLLPDPVVFQARIQPGRSPAASTLSYRFQTIHYSLKPPIL
jgi:hypothetical protein